MAASEDEGTPSRRRWPFALLGTGALAVLIAVGAALTGSLRFGPPVFNPGPLPSAKPLQASRPPQTIPSATPPAESVPSAGPNLTWLVILIGALVVAAILFIVVRWLLRRRRDRTQAVAAPLDEVAELIDLGDDPTLETGLPYLRRGLRRALQLLDEDRSPSNAIIEAWLGLQESAEDAGFQRQSAETPTEFTTRILRSLQVDAASLETLRSLYLAVRFGDATATTADVARARTALETLDAQWAAAAGSEATP